MKIPYRSKNRRLAPCYLYHLYFEFSQKKKDIRVMLEEAGFYGKKGFDYVNRRQEAIKTVK